MGLNLKRERFLDWLVEYGPRDRADLLARLERHVGQEIDPLEAWKVEDDAYPKVGSYTTYGIFCLCLSYVTRGDFEGRLDDDEDIGRQALVEFRGRLTPASVIVPYAAHFLETGDSDTLFIPLLFDVPFACDGRFVASLPGSIVALESFARGLGFDLERDVEPEFENGAWCPFSTAKNVARMLHRFFTEKQDACVALC